MITLKWNHHIIECFDSIQDTSIVRYQKFNLNLLIDSGIGSDMSAIGSRIGSIKSLVFVDANKANVELDNLYQSISFVIANLSPKYRAFVCTIKSINGRLIDESELTDDGITRIIKELENNKIIHSKIEQIVNAVKKNYEKEFETFFPELVNTGKSIEHYQYLKDRVLLVLKRIQTKGEELKIDIDKQIKTIDNFFIESLNPKVFHGSKGMEVQMINNFENTCTMLEVHKFATDAKKLMTIAFYQRLENLKKNLAKKK
jgi:hypothetical protein